MWYYAVAALLLPIELPDSILYDPDFYPTLKAIAIEHQIMDSRESDWFRADLALNSLRGRLRDLADAPPIESVMLLPERQYLSEAIDFSDAFREYVQKVTTKDNCAYNVRLADEILERRKLYNYAFQARNLEDSIVWRRYTLLNLQDAIGKEAYYSGILPPCVPVEAFRMIDD